jgi:hypothetical protein
MNFQIEGLTQTNDGKRVYRDWRTGDWGVAVKYLLSNLEKTLNPKENVFLLFCDETRVSKILVENEIVC